MSERESMEFDVVIVGAGPCGLAAACRLMQLAAGAAVEVSVAVVEKGSVVTLWVTPPPAPLIKIACPGLTAPFDVTPCSALTPAVGTQAASSKLMLAGIGSRWLA